MELSNVIVPQTSFLLQLIKQHPSFPCDVKVTADVNYKPRYLMLDDGYFNFLSCLDFLQGHNIPKIVGIK